MTKLRWGILGTANIARKIWRAVHHSGNSVITGVASRSVERCRQFAAERQQEVPVKALPALFGSYEELISSPDVDVIYIPLPTALRKEWILRAAAAGKHVLCEKPCAGTVADLREMIEACRSHRVQFMDGVMFMHNARLERIRAALDDRAAFGDLRRITSHFSFLSPEGFCERNIRSNAALEPLGCLGDLGWYCIRFALWAMNWRMPREVSARILREACCDAGTRPVPFTFSAELIFDDNISCGFYCSFVSAYSNWVVMAGTQGQLRVPDFVLPKNSSSGALEINGVVSDDLIHSTDTAQETRMVRAFAAQVLSGKLNDVWPEWALKTQIVTNACLESARAGRAADLSST